MGQAHKFIDASGKGRHNDAYGYREASSSGFFTLMAYRLANSSQFGIDSLGNPAVNYAATNRPTGTASANSGRSLPLSMPLVAPFRATAPIMEALFRNGFEQPCLQARAHCQLHPETAGSAGTGRAGSILV